MYEEVTTKLLSANPLFSQLGADELTDIIAFARIKLVEKKVIIFHKGDRGDQLIAVLKGRVQISSISEDGKEIILNLVEPGEVFGEISLLDGMERTATAMTLTASELLIISRQDFIPFLEKNPRIAIKMLAALSQRIRQTNIMMEDVLFRNLSSRLAKKLIALADCYGENLSDGSTRIQILLSHTQLGNMVDSSRESVCRQLKIWEDEKITSMDRRYIIIHNPEQLKFLSNSLGHL
jgi:CRP-like cAMP-binding protein